MIGLAMTRLISEIDRLEAENAILRQQLAAARGDTPEARRAFADVTRMVRLRQEQRCLKQATNASVRPRVNGAKLIRRRFLARCRRAQF